MLHTILSHPATTSIIEIASIICMIVIYIVHRRLKRKYKKKYNAIKDYHDMLFRSSRNIDKFYGEFHFSLIDERKDPRIVFHQKYRITESILLEYKEIVEQKHDIKIEIKNDDKYPLCIIHCKNESWIIKLISKFQNLSNSD